MFAINGLVKEPFSQSFACNFKPQFLSEFYNPNSFSRILESQCVSGSLTDLSKRLFYDLVIGYFYN